MAKVLDDVLESTEEAGNLDEINAPTEEQVQKPVEEDLPEKYRNKSVKDIIAMHQEAEKFIGKQGGEVGDLRRVVDDFIKTQTANNLKTQEVETDSTEDFFIEPKNAVNKAIENHPAVKEAQQAALVMKQKQLQDQLAKDFPNFGEIVSAPAFAEWIKASKVRTELYFRADNNFDYDAAQELLSTWNERQSTTTRVAETAKLDRDAQLKAADIGSGNAQESVSKKKYRRSDIIKLMQTDPEGYEARAPEIMLAYREGRVI
jgi:hypothetical protein